MTLNSQRSLLDPLLTPEGQTLKVVLGGREWCRWKDLISLIKIVHCAEFLRRHLRPTGHAKGHGNSALYYFTSKVLSIMVATRALLCLVDPSEASKGA